VPSVGAVSRNTVVIAACRAGSQAPNRSSWRASIASSPRSTSFSQPWKAMSSPNASAFSVACAVQPIARTRPVWYTTGRSSGPRPSSRPNAVATAQVRRPFSNGTPEARSVVSDSAASTSATRIPPMPPSIGPGCRG